MHTKRFHQNGCWHLKTAPLIYFYDNRKMGTTKKSEFLEKLEGLTEPETVLRTVKDVNSITVGKHTPCKLSFVYTSYIRYGVRAVSKFGKHASLFSYHKDKTYV